MPKTQPVGGPGDCPIGQPLFFVTRGRLQWADCPAESLLCSQGLKGLIQVKSNLAQYFLPGRQYCISCAPSYAEHTHTTSDTLNSFFLYCVDGATGEGPVKEMSCWMAS